MSGSLKKKKNLFIPLVFSFGAKIENMPVEAFLRDPTKITNSLRAIQGHFQTDGILSYGYRQALSEALGIRSNNINTALTDLSEKSLGQIKERVQDLTRHEIIQTAVEVAKRLRVLLPETLLKVAVMGPWTLANRLTNLSVEALINHPQVMSLTSKAVLNFVKAMGETGIDLLIIHEMQVPAMNGNDQAKKLLKRFYSPSYNTAKFYDVDTYMMIRELSFPEATILNKAVNGLILPSEMGIEALASFKKISVAIPVSLLEKEPDEIEAYLIKTGIQEAAKESRLQLLTTSSQIPGTINKEFMIRGIQTIRETIL
ncbi:hypothetical protein [Desulfobacula sp.]|uniref:hypothetical protein n=1 Tax=Desulfobacula sp. TaxID=2593537 RepID=UPI00260E3398|nr:hypothetical protein [Desulfobacula sp.]